MPTGADWLAPRVGTEGLRQYLETIRERFALILLCVLLTTTAAAAYLAVASDVYSAESDLLVTPVSSENQMYVGLGLIHNTNDPTRDVLTASRLVTTPPVARLVIADLGLQKRPLELLKSVEALPVTQSNIVAVTAKAHSPEQAKRLADGFARQTVANRTDALHRQLDLLLPELAKQVDTQTPEQRSGPGSLGERYLSLQSLRSASDPTIQVLSPAELPERPVSPRPKLTVAAALLAGLILGLAAAFGLRTLDDRLRREEQLRSLFRVPLLCRVPFEKSRRRSRAIAPALLTPPAHEAYRTLGSSLMTVSSVEGPSSLVVFVAGSTASEGKSTTSINLAAALAETGARVLLIEADVRHPSVGPALGVSALNGFEEVLLGTVTLADALLPAGPDVPSLQLLLASGSSSELSSTLSVARAREVISEARTLADYVVIDAPPLTEVIDALPLAHLADEIVVVARLKKTTLGKLADLGEVLVANSLRPIGTVLIGVSSTPSYYYSAPTKGGDASRRRRSEAVRP